MALSQPRFRSTLVGIALALFMFGMISFSHALPANAATYPSMWLKFDCLYSQPQPYWVDTVLVQGYNQYGQLKNQQFYSYWTGIDNTYWWWKDGSTIYYTVRWHEGTPGNLHYYYGSDTFVVPNQPSSSYWTVLVHLC